MIPRFVLQTGPCLLREKAIVRSILPSGACAWAITAEEARTYPEAVPLGSVEFVEDFARVHKIEIPPFDTYPDALRAYLKRGVREIGFGCASQDSFVKPIKVKRFTGNIKRGVTEMVSPGTPVWESDVVRFTQEWRCYVLHRELIGFARYDDFEDDDQEPPPSLLERMIGAFTDSPVGYSLDVGLCERGWALVEANDGWALGFYKGTVSASDYIRLIAGRWGEIRGSGCG